MVITGIRGSSADKESDHISRVFRNSDSQKIDTNTSHLFGFGFIALEDLRVQPRHAIRCETATGRPIIRVPGTNKFSKCESSA